MSKTQTIQKILYLPDIHVPFNIPLDPVWEFAEDWKPTKIIIGGDAHDFTSVCHWIADQSRVLDGGTVAQNFEELRIEVIQPVMKLCKSVIYLEGNHCRWLRLAALANPNGRGYWELEKNLPRGITIIPENIAYHINKNLCYMHGLYTSKYHAAQTVHACHKSVIYGHTHDAQSYTDISPVDVKVSHKAQSAGCLCNLNPHYMRNKPSRWVNGFNYCVVDNKTEHFWDTQVYIVDGEFWANGRRYK